MTLRLRVWLLPASLALNVFLIAGWIIHIESEPGPPSPDRIAARLAKGLSPEDAALLQRAFASGEDALRRSHQEMEQNDERLRAILRTEPFDKEAFRAVLADNDRTRAQFGQSVLATLPDAVAKMSAEGRRKLAESRFIGPPPPPPPPPPPDRSP